MHKKRVLLLCTGNSARSQMAEGIVNHYLSQRQSQLQPLEFVAEFA